ALRLDRCDVGREAPRRHGLGIGERDHTVDGDARAYRRPVESLQERLRQGETRRLDKDVIGPYRARYQRLDRRNEVIGHGAADAAVRQFDDVLLGAHLVGTGFQDLAVHADRAELVHQHGESPALRVLHEVADQGRLARAQEAGDDGDGDLVEVCHSALHRGNARKRLLAEYDGTLAPGDD